MKTLTFLLSTVIELYTMVVLLRVWMQWARCDFYNPFSQFVVKATQPLSDRCAGLSRQWGD
ncbi:integral membrane protein YggT [Klebsiella pneumoniae]|uniref:Integral membrane protein YggT n=1 Tax=Klebsiella pneumoniae TaxID=573 RepID=A0A378FR15_KLEPN|nr:integral membrane protein YggT [Klebsiella pneumoniae]